MKIPRIFLLAVVSSGLATAASAALPAFSQAIELPPLALAEYAKAAPRPFERNEPVTSASAVVIREHRLVSADKFSFSPRTGVDYKLLVKHPDPSVDYKLIVKETAAQPGK